MKLKHWVFEEGSKCPGCNWEATNRYGFEGNGKKEALCGDCMCEVLVDREMKLNERVK